MASWSFILTDRFYTPVGEVLNADDRKVAKALSKLDTASLRVRLDNPLADAFMECDGYLKAYRNGTLEFFGPLVSAEESCDKDSQTVSVNAVGSGWILSKRLAGKSATGTTTWTTSAADRAVIAAALIDLTNAENETGISTSLSPISAASTTTYTAGPYRPVSECIADLSTAFDGFDWRILPRDNWSAGALLDQKIGSFTAAPVLGSTQSEAIFEFGTGRHNVASYKRIVDRSTQANKVYHNAPAGPDAPGFPTVSAIDPDSISNWKLLEDLAQAELVQQVMRQQLVDEHIRVRKQPKQTLEVQPHLDDGTGRVPNYGTNFGIGDLVPMRAKVGGSVRFAADLRMYGILFEIDKMNTETQTFTLIDEG